jgi:hypothetical protein
MKNRSQRLFLSLSLRTHLFLIAFLFAIPAFGIIIYSGIKQHKATLNAGIDNSRRLANSIASEQHVLVNNAEQLLKVLAQLPDVKKRNKAEVSSLLANILKQSPQYVNIRFVIGLAIFGPAYPTKPVSMKIVGPLLIRSSKAFFSSEYRVGRISGLQQSVLDIL